MTEERRPSLSLLFELFAVSQRTSSLIGEVMSDSPLTPIEYAVYSALFHFGKATPTQAADRLGMPVTTMLDHLKVLDTRGHLAREPNPADGRSILVSLTAEGRGAHDLAGVEFDKGMLRILDHLDIPESEIRIALEALATATDRAVANLHRNE